MDASWPMTGNAAAITINPSPSCVGSMTARATTLSLFALPDQRPGLLRRWPSTSRSMRFQAIDATGNHWQTTVGSHLT